MTKYVDQKQTAIQNLNSFWNKLFVDRDILTALFRGAHGMLADNYLELLHEVASSNINTAPVFWRQYYRSFSFTRNKLTKRTTSLGATEFVLALPENVVDVEFFQNATSNASLVLEPKKDYSIERVLTDDDSVQYQLVFFQNPFLQSSIESVVIRQDTETLHTGIDGRVEGGVPNEHVPFLSDPTAALNARDTLRRTFKTNGTVAIIRGGSLFEGKASWVFSPTAIFDKNSLGLSIVTHDPTTQSFPIIAVATRNIAIVDGAFVGLPATFDFEVRNTEVFLEDFIGYEILINDVGNNNNDGLYTVKQINSGGEVLLDRALKFDTRALKVHSSCTLAGTTVTVPSGVTRITDTDAGLYAFLSDASDNYAWFKILSVGNLNASNFATEVTLDDPDSLLPGFDLISLVISVHRQKSQSFGLVWVLRTPSTLQQITLYGYNTKVETHTLRDRYGVLVNRERNSSEEYKRLLRGIMQYYWVGPSIFALRSAMSTMLGFPVIETADEILLRVDETATQDIVVTTRSSYIFPLGYVRDDLKDATNWSRYRFARLENLVKIFSVEDDYTNPTWFYGLSLPQEVWPEQSAARRRIDTRLQTTLFDGTWNFGDPGVYYGASPDGTVYADATIEFADLFVDAVDPTILTSTTTRFFPEYVGKSLYLFGQEFVIDSVDSETQITLSTPVPVALRSAVGVFDGLTSLDLVLSEQPPSLPAYANPYSFKQEDVGRAIKLDGLVSFFNLTGTITEVFSLLVSGSVLTYARVVDSAENPMNINPDEDATFSLGLQGYIINRVPLHVSPGYAVMRGFSSNNMFGITYDLDDRAVSFASLQEDIQEIIRSGKPAHTFLINQPWKLFSDLVELSDFISQFLFDVEEPFKFLSKVLEFGDQWNFGDFFFITNGYLTWNQRYEGVELTAALPPNGIAILDSDGFAIYRAFDANHATEVSVDVVKTVGSAGGSYNVDVYLWNSGALAWVPTGLSAVIDPDGISSATFITGGSYVAFLVTPLLGALDTDVAFTTGAKRNSFVEVWDTKNHPESTGSMVVDGDVLTEVGSRRFYPTDVGFELHLLYPADVPMGIPEIQKTTRIVEVLTDTTVRLVDALTNQAFESPLTRADISWKMGAQRRWGQTPLRYGDMQEPTLIPPNGVGVNQGFGVELPVQIQIDDV